MDDPTQHEPLFQNTDEQEQVFAPQQLPAEDSNSVADPALAMPIPPAAPVTTTAPELTMAAPVNLANADTSDTADETRVDPGTTPPA